MPIEREKPEILLKNAAHPGYRGACMKSVFPGCAYRLAMPARDNPAFQQLEGCKDLVVPAVY